MNKVIPKIMRCTQCHYRFFTLSNRQECSRCYGKLEMIASEKRK
jgi:rRNA maturation endonuclease Nob1